MKPSIRQKNGTWLLVLGPLVIFTAVVVSHVNQIPQLDSFMAINSSCVQLLGATIWPGLTLLGDTVVLLCLMSPLLLINGRLVLALIAAIPVGGTSSVVLKEVFSAQRPGEVLSPEDFHVLGSLLTGNSFPSGHSITAFAACSVAYVCLISARELHKANWTVFLCAFLLATLVGISRIAVGAHWPFDVIAGACIGWLAGLSGAWLTHKFSVLFESPRMSWVALLLLIVCAAFLSFRDYSEPLTQALNYLAVACVYLTWVGKALGQLKFKYE